MEMIWHDTPCQQKITLPIKVQQRIFDNIGDFRRPQAAVTITRIEQRFNSTVLIIAVLAQTFQRIGR